ncbi:hypothetical protein Tco_0594918 [Tanacetum coccineum]
MTATCSRPSKNDKRRGVHEYIQAVPCSTSGVGVVVHTVQKLLLEAEDVPPQDHSRMDYILDNRDHLLDHGKESASSRSRNQLSQMELG